MTLRSLITIWALFGAWLPVPAIAQKSTPLPSDTANALPLEPERTLRFNTDEGTWISLDVSPDGNAIVFDLLGDLYTIPITGGTATRVTHGMPWDGMPRWSPSGETIAFISDRDGGDNLWLVSPDGSNQDVHGRAWASEISERTPRRRAASSLASGMPSNPPATKSPQIERPAT